MYPKLGYVDLMCLLHNHKYTPPSLLYVLVVIHLCIIDSYSIAQDGVHSNINFMLMVGVDNRYIIDSLHYTNLTVYTTQIVLVVILLVSLDSIRCDL